MSLLVTTFALAALAAFSGWLSRRQKATVMSDEWLEAQERSDETRGIDDVCWAWPVVPGDRGERIL